MFDRLHLFQCCSTLVLEAHHLKVAQIWFSHQIQVTVPESWVYQCQCVWTWCKKGTVFIYGHFLGFFQTQTFSFFSSRWIPLLPLLPCSITTETLTHRCGPFSLSSQVCFPFSSQPTVSSFKKSEIWQAFQCGRVCKSETTKMCRAGRFQVHD